MTTPRTMFDAVTVANLPRNSQMIGVYDDGTYVNERAAHKRCPKARLVPITVTASRPGEVLDVETGDATPEQAPAWATRMRGIGRRPIVYCNRSTWPRVSACFAADDVAEPFWWIADWTGAYHLLPGTVATQYSSPSVPEPGQPVGVDCSAVSPNFPAPYNTKGHNPVKIQIPNRQRVTSLLRQLSAIIGVILALGNQLHFPVGVRVVLLAASGLILNVEHFVGDPSTGSTPPPPPA